MTIPDTIELRPGHRLRVEITAPSGESHLLVDIRTPEFVDEERTERNKESQFFVMAWFYNRVRMKRQYEIRELIERIEELENQNGGNDK